jgi:hypothetical protein
MSNYTDFREFYDRELHPVLKEIDTKRKAANKKIIIIFSVSAVILISVLFLTPIILKGMLAMVTLMASLILASFAGKDYRKEYKEKIISKINGYTDQGLVYTPGGYISIYEFAKSSIFYPPFERYRGEDHFSGKIGKTEIEFSEVVAERKETGSPGSENKAEYITVFKGLFIVADFNKHFRSRTFVLPDTAEKLFGRFGQKLQSVSGGRGDLIKLENPDFEKEFCVYGDDQVESRYILTPSMMERILEFKRKWNKKISFSFLDSKIYIAINMGKDLFETRLFKPAADYEFMEENLRFLTLVTGIVEDLNLNTRIWTKQEE